MVAFAFLPWFLTWASLIWSCRGHDSMVPVLNKLKQFEEELLDNKEDLLRTERRVLDTIDVTGTSLRAEIKENIRDEVREAMAEILQGDSLQEIVKNQIVSELWHLKRGYHQMKRQLHLVSRSLRDFQEETVVFNESLMKKAELWNQQNSGDICIRNTQRLEEELQKCTVYAADLKTRNEHLEDLNVTCQVQISRLKTSRAVSVSSQAPQRGASTVTTPVLTTSYRTQEEKRSILISAGWSSVSHQFRQLNIHDNSLSVYQYLTMKNVISIAYATRTRKLLIATRHPDQIVSSSLGTPHKTVLREHVRAFGVAVDEDRDIVFMFTYKPRISISRMSTQGKNFTAIIDLSKYGGDSRQITLDTRRKRIYGCNYQKLITVTYDGQGLTTLATGRELFAVTLDQTAGVLYYNIQKKLMKMTLSNNVSTEVTTLNAVPYNMRLYGGTIYYSGINSLIVGAVDVTYNTVAYTLQSVSLMGAGALLMCLIP